MLYAFVAFKNDFRVSIGGESKMGDAVWAADWSRGSPKDGKCEANFYIGKFILPRTKDR